MRNSDFWQDVSGRTLARAVKEAECIYIYVPFTREGLGHWTSIPKDMAQEFADEAVERKLLVHANWDGEELMIGGGAIKELAGKPISLKPTGSRIDQIAKILVRALKRSEKKRPCSKKTKRRPTRKASPT
jgi:hypothetical protein